MQNNPLLIISDSEVVSKPNAKNRLINRGLEDVLSLAKHENLTSQEHFDLAQDYLYGGNGRGIDYAKSALHFQSASNLGHAFAKYQLAVMYAKGQGVKQSDEDAILLYLESAELGVSFAQHALGYCFENGVCVKEDLDEALNFYFLAALQGHVKAITALERILGAAEAHFKLGWKQYRRSNKVMCINHFKLSAEMGFLESMLWLGNRYMHGVTPLDELEIDYQHAAYWFKKAEVFGDAKAARRLGIIFERGGYGVEQSEAESFKWYEKAALLSDAEAQCVVGGLYLHGIGTCKNNELAVSYYIQSAEQGYVHAQAILGELYELGEGVEDVDIIKAICWYGKAAAQGDKKAQESLKRLEH